MSLRAFFRKLFSNQRGSMQTATKTRTATSTRVKVAVTVGMIGLVAAAAYGFAFAPGSVIKRTTTGAKIPSSVRPLPTSVIPALPCTGMTATPDTIPTTIPAPSSETLMGQYTVRVTPNGCAAKLTALVVASSVNSRFTHTVDGRTIQGPALKVFVDGTEVESRTLVTRETGDLSNVQMSYVSPEGSSIVEFTPSKSAAQVRVYTDTRGALNAAGLPDRAPSFSWYNQISPQVKSSGVPLSRTGSAPISSTVLIANPLRAGGGTTSTP